MQGWVAQYGFQYSVRLLVVAKFHADGDKYAAVYGRARVGACRSLLGDIEDDPTWHTDPSWLQSLGHIKSGARHVQFGTVDATHCEPDCCV